MTLRDQLLRDEGGHRLKGYQDSEGRWTIGVGHCVETRPISRRASDLIFEDDVADTVAEVRRVLPWAEALGEVRFAVLVGMAYNIGTHGLLDKNPKMLAACRAGDFALAAAEMLDGPWKDQVGPRAHRLSEQMKTGTWI